MRADIKINMKIRNTAFALFFVLIMSVLHTACMKKYICHCQISYEGYAGLPDTATRDYEIMDTKTKAQSECEKQNLNTKKNYITTREDCKLY
ncbi:MAG: hypothetical protein EBX41_08965 [Chitinophagia bacterium]|nr:hypothetical protein [Chitinophagia bacterium]